ncbi:MAG: fluoride efflux transporter CrcB [Rhodospirillales bacterium]|jgi:fluoride exporter|nr:fluoride efflux transporter CrcB [Rhodospirillales bacterium]MBT4038585.1 fluoride efflux transporter CrcB [Rhodospirillales bacterium]MBT4627236.1 fluoride efflux transporter CrcB [Rhodospirillales bacterium]MBT5351574.1 fluoride efflux transporter CrcB [Rhodospirillales bacterium]MBT5521218.1 fluoride efflux transporter CrcB [Rhodospirillales bacterium]
MSIKLIVWVAAGGAMGAVARYLSMSAVGHWFGHGFPWGTIVVNVVGSFVLGALVETFALVWSPSDAVRTMLVVGVLGSFTTFSTFSLDIQTLIARGSFMAAGGYVAGSVVAGIMAFMAGMAIFRLIWS